MIQEQHGDFSLKRDFLNLMQAAADEGSLQADLFMSTAGQKLPATLDGLGTVLSILYRLACCAWGCHGGDHQIEWLTGKIVNHAAGSHRLIRSGNYDEALALVRGIGEIANLLWLFEMDPAALAQWKSVDRRERMKQFSPVNVRERLKTATPIGAPIGDDRYRALCEVATHPQPLFPPGHYSGTGRPVLGVLIQPAGIYATNTELGYAVAMAALPLGTIIGAPEEVRERLKTEALALTRALGSITILNYEEKLATTHDRVGGKGQVT
jgi:hypothetical protein